MAWRPHDLLIKGMLDNTVPGKVTGWMRFRGLTEQVTFDLDGDFHRDIRGCVIKLTGEPPIPEVGHTEDYMDSFSLEQKGEAGDITAGRPPADYVAYPYIEWYSEANGRCVLELEPDQITVTGTPLDPETEEPICRHAQQIHLQRFVEGLVVDPPE